MSKEKIKKAILTLQQALREANVKDDSLVITPYSVWLHDGDDVPYNSKGDISEITPYISRPGK
jgi:hypothetical protein